MRLATPTSRENNIRKRQNPQEEIETFGGEFDSLTEVNNMVIAAHLGADSSQYSIQTHEHYKGNP